MATSHLNLNKHALSTTTANMTGEDKDGDKDGRSSKRLKKTAIVDNEETQSDSSRAETPQPLQVAKQDLSKPVKKNAFDEIMSKKPKPPPQPIQPSRPPNSRNPYALNSDPRSNLSLYLLNPPTSCPPGTLLFHTPSFVIIKDAFPKATVHALILPRDLKITHEHPIHILNSNPDLLASIRAISIQTRDILAKQLAVIHRHTSQTEITRQKAFEKMEDRAVTDPSFDPDSDENMAALPPHRDWAKTIKIGVHSRPSMSNFHVHVISEDMHSNSLKKKAHYNSFNSDFFVPLDDFPFEDVEGDVRIPGVKEGAMGGELKGDMRCWKCKRNFRNKFKELKEHLELEYDDWKRI
ncbi:aprataxin-like protein [Orbilia ellipsospora]|uniref:Aprataxin-like protein n=1 Tax=Orbilia ellipsospora TaxID=2528407 RepID=A0AAV9XJ43_9PEZI